MSTTENGSTHIGITTGGEQIVIVGLDKTSSPATVVIDETWHLQKGDRPDAYKALHLRLVNLLKEYPVAKVIVKGSAASKSTTSAHLLAAEVRGVVLAASACSGTPTAIAHMPSISRTFGKRKAGEYICDDQFWSERVGGDIRKGSREAAFLIMASEK